MTIEEMRGSLLIPCSKCEKVMERTYNVKGICFECRYEATKIREKLRRRAKKKLLGLSTGQNH